jgi:hypothetical protein
VVDVEQQPVEARRRFDRRQVELNGERSGTLREPQSVRVDVAEVQDARDAW